MGRCKNKPVGIVIRGKYMAKRKLGLENPWHMADTAVGIVPRDLETVPALHLAVGEVGIISGAMQ